jgi:hypothetical protein
LCSFKEGISTKKVGGGTSPGDSLRRKVGPASKDIFGCFGEKKNYRLGPPKGWVVLKPDAVRAGHCFQIGIKDRRKKKTASIRS